MVKKKKKKIQTEKLNTKKKKTKQEASFNPVKIYKYFLVFL